MLIVAEGAWSGEGAAARERGPPGEAMRWVAGGTTSSAEGFDVIGEMMSESRNANVATRAAARERGPPGVAMR